MAISKKQILKTALLPGIIPRLKNFFGSGSAHLSYLIALVYNTVRILPNNHPYLQADSIGKYSIRQVITEAANHINPSRKNIDQIIIFFSVIAAIILLLIQFLILIFAVVIPQARAAEVTMPDSIAGFFVTPNPQEDIAYRLMDLVFGIPGIFGSKDLSESNVHNALHSLFEFYSFGMLLVGVLILIYFIITVVAETAQSGIPFGQRFNKAWAPIRIILFFALLIPISNGINGAQYIMLTTAKLGSSLASTGWVKYNESITETLTGSSEVNVATPSSPNITHIPAFMLIVKTCQIAYHKNSNATDYFNNWDPDAENGGIRAWAVYKQKSDGAYTSVLMASNEFQDLAADSISPTISIVFGVKDEENYRSYNGSVYPICGSLALNITDLAEPGPAVLHTAYYDLIKDAWKGELQQIKEFADNFTKRYMNIAEDRDPAAELPDQSYKDTWVQYLESYMGHSSDDDEELEGAIPRAVKAQIEEGDWTVSEKIRDYGWGGAAIWYNKIAQQNGALISALHQTPITVLYPEVMERAREHASRENSEVNPENQFDGTAREGGAPLPEHFSGESEILATLNHTYQYWEGAEEQPGIYRTGNALIDTINVILGTDGLFKMCANADVHPLAQLSSVGKSMVDSAIRSYAAAGIFSIASIIPNPFSGAAESMSGFFGTIGSIGLLVGFILFYVLPFMPFLYFFFAVGGWIKGIFEAMVAMPLWALAHLRIDGDGIPGEAAIQGYFLLFEIFIRPILIVFGLLASITVFAAMVKILNDIFYLVLANLAGHEPESGIACFTGADASDPSSNELNLAKRGPIDEFFFTILYTIIVYMIGTSCFKLIDMIPNNILRWINAEVPSFNDNAGDAAEGLMKYITLGGSQFGSQIGDGIGGIGKGLKGSVGQGISFLK